MNQGQTVFSQVMDHLPLPEFHKCVSKYQGDHRIKNFSCLDQFLSLAFAQLTYRESLRDIESCLRSQNTKLYHMGIRGKISKSTLADANETRDWKIYSDFAQVLIKIARPLYENEDLGLELEATIYAFDSSTIDLCLALFPWAKFRKTKAAVKMHTLLDLHGAIPTFISITDGKVADVNLLDDLILEAGSIYLMDRGYLDFLRLYQITLELAFFVTRSKSNTQFKRIKSGIVDKTTGLICDQTILLKNYYALKDYPKELRRIKYYDKITEKNLTFLTNNFALPALTIAKLYKCRWQVELFFKWIKQHLRIKKFYGTSENAVKTQIWIAISVYVLIAILKKKLQLKDSLYTILQILSINIFEKKPIQLVFAGDDEIMSKNESANQLNLFNC